MNYELSKFFMASSMSSVITWLYIIVLSIFACPNSFCNIRIPFARLILFKNKVANVCRAVCMLIFLSILATSAIPLRYIFKRRSQMSRKIGFSEFSIFPINSMACGVSGIDICNDVVLRLFLIQNYLMELNQSHSYAKI